MQDVHINMPFQSWEIRPKGLNHCLFTLIAAIVELEIEIKVRLLYVVKGLVGFIIVDTFF